MIRKFLLLGLLFSWLTVPVLAQCDYVDSPTEWDAFYITYKIKGYPTYNSTLSRYDFFDLDDNYCGSLCYNNINEEWEYISL